jgi:hypothetical protein
MSYNPLRHAYIDRTSLDHNDFAERVGRIVGNVECAVAGKREGVSLAVMTLLAGGHVLIEDVPGVGKTLLAKSLARSVGGEFRRIQFTPDLLPADVTGLNVYNQGEGGFEFWAGPVFANVVLADEINRASPKTQAALLECMEERQVTIDGSTYRLRTRMSDSMYKMSRDVVNKFVNSARNWSDSYAAMDLKIVDVPRAIDGRAPDVFRKAGWVPMR